MHDKKPFENSSQCYERWKRPDDGKLSPAFPTWSVVTSIGLKTLGLKQSALDRTSVLPVKGMMVMWLRMESG